MVFSAESGKRLISEAQWTTSNYYCKLDSKMNDLYPTNFSRGETEGKGFGLLLDIKVSNMPLLESEILILDTEKKVLLIS